MRIKSPEDFHNKIGFVFHGMLALPLAAFVFLFLEIRHRNMQPALTGETLIYFMNITLPLLAAIITGGGYYLFRKGLRTIEKNLSLKVKLATYFNLSVKFYGFIGIASILLVLGLFFTTSVIFIIGYVLVLFLMSLNRPTLQKYIKDLPLSKEERNIILHKRNFNDSSRPSPTIPEEN